MTRIFVLTALAMIAFAGNSLLCRQALKHTTIDAATFTLVRVLSGAICLWVIVQVRRGRSGKAGSWPSALALFGYAALFSFAYLRLTAGTGALLLFGAVQATMICWALVKGERFRLLQTVGLILAVSGLVALVFPGLSAPPLGAATLMLGAGIAWGIYSLRGKGAGDPLRTTAGNFLRAVPMAVLLSAVMLRSVSLDAAGIGYAIVSGAIASGVGYAIWYSALPALKASAAATVQLSVPVLAAGGGILFLGETITLRFALASIAVLGGIALVIVERRAAR
ncbi:MAG TPA: DMT family transporter [Chthoniobacterales bacterium]|jgi:drug/metabolite transporter (DMT)-like permease|nr:DMT family transporter [Chthoniobacterales bacterium]